MRFIGVNDRGLRVGQDHPAAKLSNAEVELMLGFRAEGWSYRKLADKFEVSKSCVRWVVKGLKRHQIAVSWRAVVLGEPTVPGTL